MDLQKLLADDSVGMDVIADALDGASASARREAAHSLDRSQQRALFRKAAASPPIDFSHFVPPEHGALDPVRHAGRNTLFLPRKLQFFEKRFCKPEDGSERLFGYNQSPFINTVGPGFFVTIRTNGHPGWSDRGALVVDYFQVPDGPVAKSWPPVIPNTQGLQKFVYHRTRDFMRRVSKHVSIGAAYKGEKSLDHYFVLVRQDDGGAHLS